MTKRTHVFFLLTVMVLISELLAPVTGSLLMDRVGANFCYLLGIPAYLLIFVILWFIPETAKLSEASSPNTEELAELSKQTSGMKQRLAGLMEHVKTEFIPILSRGTLVLGMLSLLVSSFARPVFAILMQYMTIRFDWKYSQVCLPAYLKRRSADIIQSAYLISFQAGVQMFLLCLVLPFILAWLSKRLGDPEKANLVLSKGSVVFLILGTLGMGLSQNVIGIFSGITATPTLSPSLKAN